jgi:hypothetical protein
VEKHEQNTVTKAPGESKGHQDWKENLATESEADVCDLEAHVLLPTALILSVSISVTQVAFLHA